MPALDAGVLVEESRIDQRRIERQYPGAPWSPLTEANTSYQQIEHQIVDLRQRIRGG